MPGAVHVTRGASYLIIQVLANNVVSLTAFAVLARLITPGEMGIMAVLLLVGGICQTFASFAIPQATTKFVAEQISQGRKNAAASVFYQAFRVTLLLAVVAGVTIFLSSGFLASRLLGESSYTSLFQVASLDIVVIAGVLPVLGSTMYGLQKFKESAVVGLATQTLLGQGLIIGLIILLRSLVGLVLGWLLSDLVTALTYFVYVLRALGRPKFDFELRRLVRFSAPLSIGTVANFAQSWFDRTLLVLFVPLATFGIYNATITSFGVLGSISGAMATPLFSAYSTIQAPNQKGLRTQSVRLASRYVNFLLIPLSLGLMVTAKPALTLFLGNAYVSGTAPFVILSATFAFTGFAATALSPMLLALEETKIVSAVTIVSVVISLAAALLLIPVYGILGAAVARGTSIIAAAILTVLVLGRKMKLEMDLEATAKSLIASSAMAAVLVIVQLLVYNSLLLPLYALAGLIVYVAMLRVLGAVRPHDIEMIRSYLGLRLAFIADILSRILL